MLDVELDAFSGRPNPRWELTTAQAAEFWDRIRRLRPTIQDGQVRGEGLGYRGFVVRPTGEPVGGFDHVTLYRGTVLVQVRDRTERFSDPNRGLERWLLDSARGQVSESVLSHIQPEIGR